QKGMECTRDPVGAGLKRQLINSVMCVRGKSAALSGFEVHGIVPDPSHIATAVVIENSFPTLAQHRESDSETTIGGFGSSHGLKKQIYRHSAIHSSELRSDMRQAACLRWNPVDVDQAIECRENVTDGFH